MELLSLEGWPFAVRYLVESAQAMANVHGHELTSPAHINAVLWEMKPVRALVGDRLSSKSVEAAVLVEKRGGGKMAVLTQYLFALLGSTGPRTTAAFLRSYATAHPVAGKTGLVFAAYADAIASLLDAPRLEEIVKAPGAEAQVVECNPLALGFLFASERRHAIVTPRHLVLGSLVVLDSILKKRGLPGCDEPLAKINELLERTTPKRAPTDTTLLMSPKVVGILAGLLAEGGNALKLELGARASEDDEALAFAIEARQDALTRLRADMKAASPTAS